MLNSDNKPFILFLCSWHPNTTNPTLGNFVIKHKEAASIKNEVASLAVFSRIQQKSLEITVFEGKKNNIVCYCRKYSGFKKLFQFFHLIRAYHIGYKTILSDKGKPDLVHLNVVFPAGLFALYLKWFYRIPYVTTEHSTAYVTEKKSMNFFRKLVSKIILRNSEFILPVSKDLGKHLSKMAPNTPQEIITNVVDENTFIPNFQSSLSLKKKREFIHISTLNENKNIPGLLRVIKDLSIERNDFFLKIITDGDLEFARKYCTQNDILNSVVVLEGTKTTTEIANAMREADALLLFSNLENFPCVIAEAMMCGIPTISTNVNGIPEHVNVTNGILLEKEDEKTLKWVLNKFLDGKYIFNKREIHDHALKNFSYQIISEKFTSVYRRVLSNKN